MALGSKYGRIDRIKLYFDRGKGFNEIDSCYFNGIVSDVNRVSFDIPVPSGLKALRVDPSDLPCMVRLLGCDIPRAAINGKGIDGSLAIYSDEDPQMIFDTGDYGRDILHLEYRIEFIDKTFFAPLSDLVSREKEREAKGFFGRREIHEEISLS